MYSIGTFAKMVDRSVKTLQRWDRDGVLIAHRSPTNRRYYTYDQYEELIGKTRLKKKAVVYARVSNRNQVNDLKKQKEYLTDFCRNAGIAIDEWWVDIGSGLNFKRINFNKLLDEVENNKVGKIIIAHKDRFVRFGFDWFKGFCEKHNCEIVVINDERLSPEDEIIKYLVSIIHVFFF